MASIRRIYNHIQERRRSRSRSRSLSSSSEIHLPTMSTRPKAECRECRMGIFCYDHVESSTQPVAIPDQNEPPSTSNSKDTEKLEAKVSESDNRTSSSGNGVFERSHSDSNVNSRSSSRKRPRSPAIRDPALPQIFVEGVELPYWKSMR